MRSPKNYSCYFKTPPQAVQLKLPKKSLGGWTVGLPGLMSISFGATPSAHCSGHCVHCRVVSHNGNCGVGLVPILGTVKLTADSGHRLHPPRALPASDCTLSHPHCLACCRLSVARRLLTSFTIASCGPVSCQSGVFFHRR